MPLPEVSPPPLLLRPRPEPAPAHPGGAAAWRALGWFGLLLATVSLGDIALTWYPLRLGRPEWEFGTVAASYAGLPLLATGMAALLASALAGGRRWPVRLVAAALLLLALALAAGTLLFLLDVPLALRFSPPEVLPGIRKTVAKTLLLGTLFPAAFAAAAAAALRHAPPRRSPDHV